MANRRMFYAVEALSIAEDGSNSYTFVHGVQTVGMNTTFNLENIFELGQLSLYQIVENVPDVEITIERVLDGTAPIYTLATQGRVDTSLVGRSNAKCSVAMQFYNDNQALASGSPLSEVVVSGAFVSQISYKLATEGNATESVTMVANNKKWQRVTSGDADYFAGYTQGSADGEGLDAAEKATTNNPSGVNRRQHIVFASSKLPCNSGTTKKGGIPGVNASGVNVLDDDLGCFRASVQSVSVSANLGREQMLELGRKAPYFRYVKFPVEVSAEFEVMNKVGDLVEADELTDNVSDQAIKLVFEEGLSIDLGTSCKLTSVNNAGGGADGGNGTVTYSYRTYNDFDVTHPEDPDA